MEKNCSGHSSRDCHLCAPLRHPSQLRTRRALSALPRQARAEKTGGAA
ncbi:hypothetical protein [Streptomyces sp. 2P-4]|nr:hypothetical protein [Streptomyces sp. 2P-4]